jgi:putative ABC transport system substrate-binding protein
VSRFFVLAVLLMALAAPGICSAQQAKNVWRVGYVSPYSAEFVKPWLGAFVGGMKDLGYTEGKHLVIEVRHSQGDDDRLSQLARELADLKIDIFLVHGGVGTVAARSAAGGKPIVFVPIQDPVGMGIVSSLARPGGNITGLSDMPRSSSNAA